MFNFFINNSQESPPIGVLAVTCHKACTNYHLPNDVIFKKATNNSSPERWSNAPETSQSW